MKKHRFLSILLFAAAMAAAFAYGRLSAQTAVLNRLLQMGESEEKPKNEDPGRKRAQSADNKQTHYGVKEPATQAGAAVSEVNQAAVENINNGAGTDITKEKSVAAPQTRKTAKPQKSEKSADSGVKSSEIRRDKSPHGHGNYTIMLNTKTYKYHTKNCRTLQRSNVKSLFTYKTTVPNGTKKDIEYIESLGYTACRICSKQENNNSDRQE